MSLEVGLGCLPWSKFRAYVEAASVGAFAKFGDALLAKGTFVEAWPKCKELLFLPANFGRWHLLALYS